MTFNPPGSPPTAVIGLGSMGLGMARALLKAGFAVSGYDVVPAGLTSLADAGGRAATSPAEAASGADVVVCVVVNASQTESVLYGPEGVLTALRSGAVFVSSATMDPAIARDLARRTQERGIHYLDAPMSGGAQRASEGDLTFLASGSDAAFAAARPALEVMAGKVYELGSEPGQGAAFKMINQLLAGVHIAAASEAIAFAARQNLDLQKVYEVITASAGNSWMFENRIPHVLDGD